MHFGFPYRIGPDGRSADASADAHVRELIELVLFTAQGERVRRPDFGAGVRQMLFAENSPELASALQHLVQSALQRFLADAIEVRGVDVRAQDAQLVVQVRFRALESDREELVRLVREA